MKIPFSKMNGAGNDFIVLDNRRRAIQRAPQLARRLCDRRFGVGGDGLLLIEKSDRADYTMKYYNADGSFGGMCGNGGRCVSLYAYRHAIAKRIQSFEALGHVYASEVSERSVSLRMKNPLRIQSNLVLRLGSKRLRVTSLDTGSPHVVIFVGDLPRPRHSLDGINVVGLGKAIRNHTRFRPSGTNVNFVELSKSKALYMRTFERGVEAETLACGTGAVATAIAASMKFGLRSPIAVKTRSRKTLTITFDLSNGVYRNVILVGPAEESFAGTIDL